MKHTLRNPFRSWSTALLLLSVLTLSALLAPVRLAVAASTRLPTTSCGRPGTIPQGSFPRVLHVGKQPTLVGVSERTGHAFVINQGEQKLYGKLVCRSSLTTLNASSGRFIRSWTVGEVPAGMVVDDRDGLVFVASAYDPRHKTFSHGYLNVFDTQGRGTRGGTNLNLQAGGLYQMGVDQQIHRLFVVTYQSVIGFNTLNTNQVTSVHIAGIGYGGITAPLAVDARHNRVFIPTRYGVSVLDARTGAVIQTIRMTDAERTLGIDGRTGRVFVASAGDCVAQTPGTLTTLNAATGKTLSTIGLSCFKAGPVIVDEPKGLVLAGTASGGSDHYAILDARTGKEVRTLPAYQNLPNAVVDGRTGLIYVANQACTAAPARCRDLITVIDPARGRAVRTIRVAHAYQGFLAVAQSARRIFATSPYFDTVTVLQTV